MICKVVAELSANHNGSLKRALAIVDAVHAAGAAAVKLQTWAAGMMVLDPALRVERGPWAGENMSGLYDRALMPWNQQRVVFAHARDIGLECFSSVFDLESLAFLQSLGCPRYKIASFEAVDIPLIMAVAATKKPIIISTGMATKVEIGDAVTAARQGGARDITLLKCTSAYPADGSSANLAMMRALADWDIAVGLSDHTVGIGVAVTAAALGATMIEKHVTLSRADGGLDSGFSLEPAELAQLVREVAGVERAIGASHQFGPTEQEKPQLELRRSLYFAADLPAGTYLGEQHIRSARPALGIAPRFYRRLLGSRLRADVRRGTPVSWDMVELRELVRMG